jgi:hypothetical protein
VSENPFDVHKVALAGFVPFQGMYNPAILQRKRGLQIPSEHFCVSFASKKHFSGTF